MWSLPGFWILQTVVCAETSSRLGILLVMGMVLLSASFVKGCWAHQLLHPGLLLTTVVVCYSNVAGERVAIPLGATNHVMVYPAAFALAVGSVVVLFCYHTASQPLVGSRATLGVVIIGLCLVFVVICLTVVLKPHYPIAPLTVLRGVCVQVVELSLLLFLAVRLVPLLGPRMPAMKILGISCVLAAGLTWFVRQ